MFNDATQVRVAQALQTAAIAQKQAEELKAKLDKQEQEQDRAPYINKLQDELGKAKQTAAKAQRKLDDLRDELKKKVMPNPYYHNTP